MPARRPANPSRRRHREHSRGGAVFHDASLDARDALSPVEGRSGGSQRARPLAPASQRTARSPCGTKPQEISSGPGQRRECRTAEHSPGRRGRRRRRRRAPTLHGLNGHRRLNRHVRPFWTLVILGAWSEDLQPKRIAAFLILWLIGLFGLPLVPYGAGMFTSYVAVLDVALVFIVLKVMSGARSSSSCRARARRRSTRGPYRLRPLKLYVPQGTWHGGRNTGREALACVAIYSPSGFEGYFREIGRRAPDNPPRSRTLRGAAGARRAIRDSLPPLTGGGVLASHRVNARGSPRSPLRVSSRAVAIESRSVHDPATTTTSSGTSSHTRCRRPHSASRPRRSCRPARRRSASSRTSRYRARCACSQSTRCPVPCSAC